MLSYQQNYFSPCVTLTAGQFTEIAGAPALQQQVHRCTDAYRRFGKGAAYNAEKKRLPLMMFCCTFDRNRGARGRQPEDTWRCQQAVRLNGLFMYDADELQARHGLTPRELFEKIPQWLFDTREPRHILYAGMTPSGDGLRLVATCSADGGNLADHQQWLGTLLGVACDQSVKDASRGSFVVSSDYIYYIDNNLFSYHNETYAQKYNDCYRSGHTATSDSPAAAPGAAALPARPAGDAPAAPAGEGADGAGADADPAAGGEPGALPADYHGVSLQKIVDTYLARNPDYTTGDRHPHLLKMAGRLRYIVDNSPEKLRQLVRLAPYVREWEQAEHNAREIDDVCTTACQQRFYAGKPKALQDVLLRAGVSPRTAADDADRQAATQALQRLFAQRLGGSLPEPYATVMEGLNPLNAVPAVFASGAMFCTLMTRLRYVHYTGSEQRMNPQAVIIGPPASGKSFAEELNQIIMAPMKQADEMARQAEKRYKDEAREFSMGKAKSRGDAPKRPELPIRYLPTNTSNAVFFRRLANAVEEQPDGQELRLHLYMFDSELASANKRNGGADWIGKRDLELKAFHNEETGVDYANNDSVNEMMPVMWNSVTTGTKVALARKFTLQNINDGLCLRIAIAEMVSDRYVMLARGNADRNARRRARLVSWAYDMQTATGLLPIGRLVDHSYDLCEQAAREAEQNSDLVLDTLRRRAALYAVWYTVPVLVTRAIEERRRLAAANKEGADLPALTDLVTVGDADLRFCDIMFDAVVKWQDAFFGQMLQEAWDNGDKAFQPRLRRTRNAEAYGALPQEFRNADVQRALGVGSNTASQQITRWQQGGYIERLGGGRYKKVVDYIL